MTPEQPEFIKLTQDVTAMRNALLGDPLAGKPGMLSGHSRLMEDIYGQAPDGSEIESKRNTILVRVSDIEDKQKKALWIFSGIVLACVALKTGVTALIDKLFK